MRTYAKANERDRDIDEDKEGNHSKTQYTRFSAHVRYSFVCNLI